MNELTIRISKRAGGSAALSCRRTLELRFVAAE